MVEEVLFVFLLLCWLVDGFFVFVSFSEEEEGGKVVVVGLDGQLCLLCFVLFCFVWSCIDGGLVILFVGVFFLGFCLFLMMMVVSCVASWF